MLTAEAHIKTERPSRYLAQLCRHVSNIYNTGRDMRHRRRSHAGGEGPGRPGLPVHVEWSETRGTVTFGGGTITMQASPGVLTVRAEAADRDILRQIQDLITGLLGRFGRRDQLTVHWQRPGAHTVQPADVG
jgi:hypothetical protein